MPRRSCSAACTSWPRPPRCCARTSACSSPIRDAGCSLADSITAEQLRAWKARHPGAIVVMYVNTTAEVKAETDYCCTSANAVRSSSTSCASTAPTPRSCSAPTCSSAPTSRRRSVARCTCGTASATSTPGIKPDDIAAVRAGPSRRRLPHPPRVRLLDQRHGVRRRRGRRHRGRAHALHGRDARLRPRARAAARRSWPPRRACCTRCARPRPTSSSSPPTRPRTAGT